MLTWRKVRERGIDAWVESVACRDLDGDGELDAKELSSLGVPR